MKFKSYLRTWEGAQTENKWSRVILGALVFIILLLTAKVMTKEQIITIKPFTLTEEAWVTKSSASQSYQEAWAFAFSQLVGNVTPGTVDFIKERLTPFLSPRIYTEVVDAIEIQAREIKNDRVTMRFEPRSVEHEEETGKTFVFGYSFRQGASGKPERKERTYEYVISISNYAPSLDHITTYVGKPRTLKVLEQLKRKQEARRQNAAR